MTIARDVPLRHTDLAPKECLFRAYENGSLISVVPFVSRLIQAGIRSKWYTTPTFELISSLLGSSLQILGLWQLFVFWLKFIDYLI